MTPQEISLRTRYLLVECLRAIDQVVDRCAAEGRLPPETRRVLQRELGLLFRHWAARELWARLEAREADASAMNLTLLRGFTEALRLPRDGSGLRYAELSTPAQELSELRQRLRDALGPAHIEPADFAEAILVWREIVARYVAEATDQPVGALERHLQETDGPGGETRLDRSAPL